MLDAILDPVIAAFPYVALGVVPVGLALAGYVGGVLAHDELVAWRATRPRPPAPAPAPVPVPIVTESVRVLDPQRAARLAATAVMLVAVTVVV